MSFFGSPASARCPNLLRSSTLPGRLAATALAALLAAPLSGYATQAATGHAPPEPYSSACTSPLPGQALTLADAVERALCSQPTTRLAAAQWQAARAAHEQAQVAQRPSLTLSAGTQHSDSTLRAATHAHSAELRLSWLLYDAGRAAALTQSAWHETLAAHLETSDEAQAVMLEAARRYLAVAASRALAEAARTALHGATVAQGAARARLQAGETVRLDVLQAQSRRARAELALVRAEREAQLAQLALAQYVGAPLEEAFELAPTPAGREAALSLSQALARLDDHPQLRALAARVHGTQARERAAAAQSRPTVALSASLSAQHEQRFGRTAGVGLQLTIPLHDAGLAQAQQAAARAQTQAAQAREAATRHTLELAVAQQYTQLRATRSELAATEALLVAARAAEEHAAGRYQAGVGLLLEWLDAQAAVAQARTEHVHAQNAVLFARWALARALGALSADTFSTYSTASPERSE